MTGPCFNMQNVCTVISEGTMASRGRLLWLLAAYIVLTTDVTAIPLQQFYPYGVENGDSLIHRNDDGFSLPVPLPSQFNFFGQSVYYFYVSYIRPCQYCFLKYVSLSMRIHSGCP